MVQRVLADRLQLVLRLVTRLRAVVIMAALSRPGTLRSLRLTLGDAAVDGSTTCTGAPVHTRRTSGRMCALSRKGLHYALLRHDGSIDGRATGGDGLGTQRTGGGRVDEAGIAGVPDAMYD